jgi:hypothetical protein
MVNIKKIDELYIGYGFAEYVLPSHWAGYLINGDASGYSDEEITEIDKFVTDNELGFCTGVSDDSWFAHKNDANSLGADVSTFTFAKVNESDDSSRKKLKNVKMFEEFVEDGYEMDAEDMEDMNTEPDTVRLTDGRTLTLIEVGGGEWKFDVNGKNVSFEDIRDLIPAKDLDWVEETIEESSKAKLKRNPFKTSFRKKL